MAEFPIYVTAYYHIPRKNSRHMGIDRYLRLIPDTVQMLEGSSLFLFFEEEFIRDIFQRLADLFDIQLIPIQRPVQKLMAYDQLSGFVRSYWETEFQAAPMFRFSAKGEKGVNHYNYFVKGQEPEICAQNLSIYLSKIDLVDEAIRRSGHESSLYTWVDAGISRVNGRRTNWDFTKLDHDGSRISHYGSSMRFHGKRLPVSAGYLAGRVNAWKELHSEFYKLLPSINEEAYIHDEETLIGRIHAKRPELFSCLGMPVYNKWDTLRVIKERLRQKWLA